MIIIGGIYSGVFSPTEAAAVVVIYAWRSTSDLSRIALEGSSSALVEAGSTSGSVMFIVASASLLAWVLNYFEAAQEASRLLLSATGNKMDPVVSHQRDHPDRGLSPGRHLHMYLLLPIVLPVALRLGVDPNHFGIIVVVNLAIGQITPPVGVNLFVACGISKISLGEISQGVWPLVAAEAVALLLITFIPALSLALPGWVGG